jgi:prepilin-type N-terminal cleavage/methylation domain-containing protein
MADYSKKGFTLVEVLMVISLFAVVAYFSVPVVRSFQANNDSRIGVNSVAQALRRAQLLSQAVAGDSSWGVSIQVGRVVVFKGTDYATGRDAAFDEELEISPSLTPSGVSEVIFTKLSGTPETTGDIILTTAYGSSEAVNLNGKGTVTFVNF